MYKKNNHDDIELFAILADEEIRQKNVINLIASENYASPAVMQATGSVLTNKYAEGYPGKRYYAGCRYVDQVELLAIKRCKELFGAEHVNVQPHCGSQANMAVYHALLKPGDTILGMNLAEGGHLTHGHPINFSGSLYNCIGYAVNKETEMIDYEEIAQLADIHKPKLIIAGASAYSRIIDFSQFARIAKHVGAFFMADIAHIAGLIAAGLHPSPIEHADVVTSTTHKTLRGPRGGLIMSKKILADTIDKAVMPGIQGGPFMHVIAAKSVAFHEALASTFKTYQQQVIANARIMADTFARYGYRIVAGGTDNHLFIIDLQSHAITGKDAQALLESVGIIVNKNCIPFDSQKPWITSGIRIGTAAITTRNAQAEEVERIACLIDKAIINRENTSVLASIKNETMLISSALAL
jgi:glycine hydroxymethyltransferase